MEVSLSLVRLNRLIRTKGHKEKTMKRLHFALGLLAAVACSGLHAQNTNVRASIPFDFQIGETRMPGTVLTQTGVRSQRPSFPD